MRVSWQMDYLIKHPKTGIYRYRRRVPKDLRPTVGVDEIVVSLKTADEAVALSRYGAAHEQAEAKLGRERAKSREQIIYEATLADLKGAGLVAPNATNAARVSMDDQEIFDAYTRAALGAFNEMTPTQMIGPPSRNDAGSRILLAQLRGVERPKIRLGEAISFYLAERQTNHNAADLAKQCNLARVTLVAVMGDADPQLEDIDLDAAYAFRAHLVAAGNAPASVKRRITTIKAILNKTIKGKRLKGMENPFNSLETISTDGLTDKERRDALSIADIKACVSAIDSKNDDVKDIWRLVMFTGARPKEVIGLLWDDVILDHPTPHIHIRPNRLRGLKTKGSRRRVPLVGVALEVIRRRLADRSGGQEVFPRYAGKGGPNSVSALQVKAMKQAGVWVTILKVPYSLRHSVRDWIERVAPPGRAALVLGHTVAGAGITGDYGSDTFLDMLAGNLTAALMAAGVWNYPNFGGPSDEPQTAAASVEVL